MKYNQNEDEEYYDEEGEIYEEEAKNIKEKSYQQKEYENEEDFFRNSSGCQFVIPVYQRNYDWKDEQCHQLWNDILVLSENPNEKKTHFRIHAGFRTTVVRAAIHGLHSVGQTFLRGKDVV